MKILSKFFNLYGKPGKVILFSFLLTFFALLITYSTVVLLVRRDARQNSQEAVTASMVAEAAYPVVVG